MYVTFMLLLRSAGGFGLSALLSVVGLVFVWVLFRFSDGNWSSRVFYLAWYSGAGIGAGLGSFLAWIEPESSRPRLLLAFLSFVLAGLAGAWAGYWYKAVLYENPGFYTGVAVSAHALLWSTLGVNIVASSIRVVREVRAGWM